MKRTPKAAKVNWRARAKELEESFRDQLESCTWAENALKWTGVAAELNMSAYEDALAYSKTNHALVTELRAELDGLKRDYKAQIERTHAENERDRQANVDEYNKLWSESTEEIDSLRGQNETLENLLATQRALLIQYNTRGNLIHWFGEFLLAKEPRA